jgi:hypothetical protein
VYEKIDKELLEFVEDVLLNRCENSTERMMEYAATLEPKCKPTDVKKKGQALAQEGGKKQVGCKGVIGGGRVGGRQPAGAGPGAARACALGFALGASNGGAGMQLQAAMGAARHAVIWAAAPIPSQPAMRCSTLPP